MKTLAYGWNYALMQMGLPNRLDGIDHTQLPQNLDKMDKQLLGGIAGFAATAVAAMGFNILGSRLAKDGTSSSEKNLLLAGSGVTGAALGVMYFKLIGSKRPITGIVLATLGAALCAGMANKGYSDGQNPAHWGNTIGAKK